MKAIVRCGDLREQGRQQTEEFVRVVGVDINAWLRIGPYGRSTPFCPISCVVPVSGVMAASIL